MPLNCVSGRNVQDENDFDVGRVNVLSFRTQKISLGLNQQMPTFTLIVCIDPELLQPSQLQLTDKQHCDRWNSSMYHE